MDEFSIIQYQLMSRMNECIKKDYPRKLSGEVLELIKELMKRTADKVAKDKLVALANSFLAKALDAENQRRGRVVRVGGGETVQTADIGRLCPVTLNADIAVAEISDISVMRAKADPAYGDNTLVVCGPFASELFVQTSRYVKESGRNMRVVDVAALREEGVNGYGVLNGLIDYYSSNSSEDAIVFTKFETLKDDKDFAEAFAGFLHSMRTLCDRNKERNFQQIILLTDPVYFFSFSDMYNGKRGGHEGGNEGGSPVDALFESFELGGLNFMYMALPSYAFVKAHIFTQFRLAQDDKDSAAFIKKHGYTLGFEGLSHIVCNATAENWREELTRIKQNRAEQFKAFIERLGAVSLNNVLNEDWEYTYSSSGRPLRGSPFTDDALKRFRNETFALPPTEFDYDGVVDVESIRKSVQTILDMKEDVNHEEVGVKQKCGLVLDYAVTNGDSFTSIVNLSEEEFDHEMSIRWNIGYAALIRLMRIDSGKLVFDIGEGEGLLGQCVDGGKIIRMRDYYASSKSMEEMLSERGRGSAKNVIYSGCETLLHEAFHALQHRANTAYLYLCAAADARNSGNTFDEERVKKESELLDYYWYHFGVTRARIKEWGENFTRYHSSSEDEYVYRDQTVEADARIFASEVLESKDDVAMPDTGD